MPNGFAQSDGEQIYFELWGTTGDVLVLGHGMGGSHAVWFQQVAHFATDYRVITWDQRGFGRSTRSTGDIGPGPSVGDLLHLLDRLDIDRAHIVGQSMGGWSALGFAIDHPDRTLSLTLADTTAGLFTPEIRAVLETIGRDIADGPTPGQLPLGRHPAIGDQLTEEDLAKSFLYSQMGSLTDPPSPMEIVPLLLATDHTDRAADLTAPTLFLVGENDPLFPPPLIERAAELVPDSRRIVVPDTGHSPYFERPELWNDLVARFLVRSQH
ncbi:MAG: alpha/beta hydrolase [Acidimicrobiia bacterium]